jgi:pyruvate ferredoxin oxidoreductase delta subunit
MATKRAKNILIGKPGTSLANKTGGWRTFMPVFDKTKCNGCGICSMSCPEGCMFGDKVTKFDADLDYCKGCGICANVCPTKCISMVKEEK